MALNYSDWPLFPAHISEDNLVSPMRIPNGHLMEDVAHMNGEGYWTPWDVIPGEAGRNFIHGRDGPNDWSFQESTIDDVVELLPSDPFGMNMQNTFTALAWWLEDLGLGYGGYTRTNEYVATEEGYSLFAGWNMVCNIPEQFQLFPDAMEVNEKLNVESVLSSFLVYEELCPSNVKLDEKVKAASTADEGGMGGGLAPFDDGFQRAHNLVDDVTFHCGNLNCNSELGCGEKVDSAANFEGMGGGLAPFDDGFEQPHNLGDDVTFQSGNTDCNFGPGSGEEVDSAANFEGMPHEALGFALGYLGVIDLLSVEMVCKSLLSTVRGDPLLWRTIHIDQSLHGRITDDVLVELASRAQGNLQCLSLVECPKITDDSLRRILETNQQLTKLCIPGCTRITIESVINLIKAYNSNRHVGGIRSLRIGGLPSMDDEHFEELRFLLGIDEKKLRSDHKPLFHLRDKLYLPIDDDRSIDIERCPRCEKLRLVYDCPAEGCKVIDCSRQVCRACTLCIARCIQCGRCVNNTEYEETFILDRQCRDCFKENGTYVPKLPKMVCPSEALPVPRCHNDHHG